MLSAQENALLTQVGPGTPMNALFRRFWLPVLEARELPHEPGCPPVRVKVLGEELVAFRDEAGRVGFLDKRCPHRHASLFWGRAEDGGLRCAYHGWLFDVSGACLDVPNAPEGGTFRDKVSALAAYPGADHAGLIWVYMGPAHLHPELPALECEDVTEGQRFIRKMELPGNYLQIMEGDIDSSHVSFLHATRLPPNTATMLAGAASPHMAADRHPRWEVSESPAGVQLAARRNAGEDAFYWRVNQWLMPGYTIVASLVDEPIHMNMRVPIDDEHTLYFRYWWHPARPFSTQERTEMETGGVLVPELIPGTFKTVENMGNDYLIDRSLQRSRVSATGIRSISAQDFAMQEDQGGLVMDRTRERLVSSDAAIIAVRKRLLDAVVSLSAGQEPQEAADGARYQVRGLDAVLPRKVGLMEGAGHLLRTI
ncbi:MAG: Rieske 2Fe-2S domain-containing protein [Chloroflexota bacterium]